MLKVYLGKMKGVTKSPPAVNFIEIIWSWIGAFLGIGFISYANFNVFEKIDLLMIVGSFGASAVLIYGAVKSPLAQPRNLLGGHVLSAIVGVASYQLFHPQMWFASAMAVATSIAVMHATKTLHPPGGATALIAVIGGEKIHNLGFLYALMPVGGGVLIMLVIALLVNNIPKNRRYPEFWL
jgi:CBS-domain-containing membrane protein